ncbi:MAG TPA: hypothetical protein VHB68_03960, partial [Steroidobacteraceae bacterium]|nr:hypothetical protein [Steroidobacteraceae bacterium]
MSKRNEPICRYSRAVLAAVVLTGLTVSNGTTSSAADAASEAASQPHSGPVLEEVTVTARKR